MASNTTTISINDSTGPSLSSSPSSTSSLSSSLRRKKKGKLKDEEEGQQLLLSKSPMANNQVAEKNHNDNHNGLHSEENEEEEEQEEEQDQDQDQAELAQEELQPTINIGAIGHVAHGKSTVVRQLTSTNTGRHSSEVKKNMTIKLGYANAKIYKCDNPACPKPGCYRSLPSSTQGKPFCTRPGCDHTMSLVRHVSFVDCPGHETLMSTMINATAVMDAAVLVVAANEPCPQPQTAEHLAVADLMGLSHFVVVQNKVDLVKGVKPARAHLKAICGLLKGTLAESAIPRIIPAVAQFEVNMDMLCQQLVEVVPPPTRDCSSPARLDVIRSFDVNKPGADWMFLQGAVIGGSLSRGTIHIGQRIELRPGCLIRDPQTGDLSCRPLFTTVVSLNSENNKLKKAVPGGLIGIGTKLDPSLAKSDGLIGQVAGAAGTLPPVFHRLHLKFRLLERLVGTPEEKQVSALAAKEHVLLHVGSNACHGSVPVIKGHYLSVQLQDIAVCAEVGQRVALSRHLGKDLGWRLIGWGTITANSVSIPVLPPSRPLPPLEQCENNQ